MTFGIYEAAGIAIILAVLAGIRLMSSVERAPLGNGLGAIAMLAAIALVLWHNKSSTRPGSTRRWRPERS